MLAEVDTEFPCGRVLYVTIQPENWKERVRLILAALVGAPIACIGVRPEGASR